MPVHKVGYRKWEGKKTSHWGRWWIIGETGVLLALKSAWVKRVLFVCWLPIFVWGICIFVVEKELETRPPSALITEKLNVQIDSVNAKLEELKIDENLPHITGKDNGDGTVTIIANKNGQEVERTFKKPKFKRSGFDDELEFLNEEQRKKFRDEGLEQFLQFLKEDIPILPRVDILAEKLATGEKGKFRHTVWSWLLMTFFRYPQGTVILFLLGYIAPGLISRDVRSRAFLLYFSRPIGRMEYILGKMSTVACYILMVTTIPAFGLFLFCVMLSPDISVLGNTWDIPLRIVAASFCLVIPLSSLALMLSSLTHESRFATFAWFAIWALGHVAWLMIVMVEAKRMGTEPFNRAVLESDVVSEWSVISLYNNLGSVQSWIFGFDSISNVWPALASLALVTLLSLFVLYRRVSAPIRV